MAASAKKQKKSDELALLPEIVLKNLQEEGLLTDGRQIHLVLAYSGGLDSTALLHLLADIAETQNLLITAAYYEHGWRPKPAGELPVLHQNCKALGIPLVMIPTDHRVPQTEAAAREARYYSLTHLVQDLNADALITAHQAEDQIETILFRLFRGTGLEGLVGIQKRFVLHPDVAAPVPVIRPLLSISREHLRAYVKANEIAYFNDPSNDNTKYQRNLIRNEIVPYIQERFPNVNDALHRLSHVIDGDLSVIHDKIDHVWAHVYEETSETLDTIVFNQLGRAYQRRILKRFLSHHRLESDFNRIEDMIDFIEGENRKNLGSALYSLEKPKEPREALDAQDLSLEALPEEESLGLQAIEERGRDQRFLSMYKHRLAVVVANARKETLGPEAIDPQDPLYDEWLAQSETPVTIPGEFSLESLGATLKILPLTAKEQDAHGLLRPQHSLELYVDLSRYAGKSLVLRTRRPGDRIHPFGMATPMRLKNFFINRGVPRFQRDTVALLADGQDVLWASGVGISESLRITEKPTHRLVMEVKTPVPLAT